MPDKEAILSDRAEEFIEDMAATIRTRPSGQGVVAAFRDWHDHVIGFLLLPAACWYHRSFLRTRAARVRPRTSRCPAAASARSSSANRHRRTCSTPCRPASARP
jgi:hypothetical protein